jgi:hypothetical protein
VNAATGVRRGFTPIGFARELNREGCDYKAANGLGEFYLNIRVDPTAGVIDVFAGPTKHEMQCSQRASSHPTTVAPHTRSRCSNPQARPTSCSSLNINRCSASSATSSRRSRADGDQVSSRR